MVVIAELQPPEHLPATRTDVARARAPSCAFISRSRSSTFSALVNIGAPVVRPLAGAFDAALAGTDAVETGDVSVTSEILDGLAGTSCALCAEVARTVCFL
jgi:hypothetical protein